MTKLRRILAFLTTVVLLFATSGISEVLDEQSLNEPIEDAVLLPEDMENSGDILALESDTTEAEDVKWPSEEEAVDEPSPLLAAPEVVIQPEWEYDAEIGAITIPYVDLPETLTFEWTFDGMTNGFAVQTAPVPAGDNPEIRSERIYTEEPHVELPAADYSEGGWFSLYVTAMLEDGTELEGWKYFRLKKQTGHKIATESLDSAILMANPKWGSLQPYGSTEFLAIWNNNMPQSSISYEDFEGSAYDPRVKKIDGVYVGYLGRLYKTADKLLKSNINSIWLKDSVGALAKVKKIQAQKHTTVLLDSLLFSKTYKWPDGEDFYHHCDLYLLRITASDGSGYEFLMKVESVTDGGEEIDAMITRSFSKINSLSIAPSDGSVSVGGTMRLTANLNPVGASTILTWSSSNKKIATVDANGVVKGIKEGTVKITVKSLNNKKATVKVKVVDPTKPTKVALDQSGTVTLNLGSSLRLTATLSPSTARSDLKWSTSNKKIAKVVDGLVTPVKTGTATITVKTVKAGKTAKVKVKVIDPTRPTKVSLDQSGTITMNVGSTLRLRATIEPSTAVNSKLTWSSSNKKVVMVDSNGLVGAVKKGTATITVKTSNGKKASVKIKAIKP